MIEDILKKLATVEVHDMPVNKIEILCEKRIVRLELYQYMEDISDYVPLILEFGDVTSFHTSDIKDISFSIDDVWNIECVQKDNDTCEAKVILQMGIGKPAWVLTIVFSELEIISQSEIK